MVDALKVLIFPIWQNRVLVFDEPDFPEIPLQIPGGTVEEGENLIVAARREFFEETGLHPACEPTLIFQHDYTFERNGVTLAHRRHFFHMPLAGAFPETWHHWEKVPSDGGPPILFRLHWIGLKDLHVHFGLTMSDALGALSKEIDFPL